MKEAVKEEILSKEELVAVARAVVRKAAKKEWNRYIKKMRGLTGMEESALIQDDLYTRIIYIVYIVIIEDQLPFWVWIDLFLNGESGTIERALEIADETLFEEEESKKNFLPDCPDGIETFARV